MSSDSDSPTSSSRCPVRGQDNSNNNQVQGVSNAQSVGRPNSLWNFLTLKKTNNSDENKNAETALVHPNDSNSDKKSTASFSSSKGSGCPVVQSSKKHDPNSTVPFTIPFLSSFTSSSTSSSSSTSTLSSSQEHAVSSNSQMPHPDQQIPLSTFRAISSIPKPYQVRSEENSLEDKSIVKLEDNLNGNEIAKKGECPSNSNKVIIPGHQPASSEKWVYPSEQQFYNAMKRKGWDLPPGIEMSIPHVVRIHNAVNERGWKEIMEWERMRDPTNENPRLVRFLGRPKDLSPRARFYSMLWLRNEPFDRHDWFVDRGDGTGERRYVIDFYNGKDSTSSQMGANSLPSMYLDVRPALDDFESVQDRVKMFFKNAFPGIAGIVMNNRDIGKKPVDGGAGAAGLRINAAGVDRDASSK